MTKLNRRPSRSLFAFANLRSNARFENLVFELTECPAETNRIFYESCAPILYNSLQRSYNVFMNDLTFGWDRLKNNSNKSKHGVDFEEAQTVFYDENAKFMADPDHSTDEDRFVIMGRSYRLRIIVVCHCYRENPDVIRIITARKATKKEVKQYSARR